MSKRVRCVDLYMGVENLLGRSVNTVTEGSKHFSRCQLCNLDSGPWRERSDAAVSGLLHLVNRHPDIGLNTKGE